MFLSLKCTGAGVILKNNKNQIILFRSNNNLMNDLGGNRNDNENILTTAIRESYEESFLTVNINKNKLKKSKYYDYYYKEDEYYRCFFYHLDKNEEFDRSYFINQRNNLYYLKNNGATIPEYYFETIDIDYFNINEIDIDINKTKIKNIKNKSCKIRERTLKCLINGLKNNLL